MKKSLKYMALFCLISFTHAKTINTPNNMPYNFQSYLTNINSSLARIMIDLHQRYQEEYFDILEIDQFYKTRYEALTKMLELLNEEKEFIKQEKSNSQASQKEMKNCEEEIVKTQIQIEQCNKKLEKCEVELTRCKIDITNTSQQLIEILYQKCEMNNL